MYTAIIHIPRSFRADTETAVCSVRTLGRFQTAAAAEQAAQTALSLLHLKDDLRPYARYTVQAFRQPSKQWQPESKPTDRQAARAKLAQIRRLLERRLQEQGGRA